MKLTLLEREVVKACVDFMQYRGWRAVLMTVTSWDEKRKQAAGEKGMPDYLFLRYAPPQQILWVEFKRPKGRTKKHQLDWHTTERLSGGTIWRPHSFEEMRNMYELHYGFLHR